MTNPLRSVFSSGFLLNQPQTKLANVEKIQQVAPRIISNTAREENRKPAIKRVELSRQEDAQLHAMAWSILHPLGVQ